MFVAPFCRNPYTRWQNIRELRAVLFQENTRDARPRGRSLSRVSKSGSSYARSRYCIPDAGKSRKSPPHTGPSVSSTKRQVASPSTSERIILSPRVPITGSAIRCDPAFLTGSTGGPALAEVEEVEVIHVAVEVRVEEGEVTGMKRFGHGNAHQSRISGRERAVRNPAVIRPLSAFSVNARAAPTTPSACAIGTGPPPKGAAATRPGRC